MVMLPVVPLATKVGYFALGFALGKVIHTLSNRR